MADDFDESARKILAKLRQLRSERREAAPDDEYDPRMRFIVVHGPDDADEDVTLIRADSIVLVYRHGGVTHVVIETSTVHDHHTVRETPLEILSQIARGAKL